MRTVSELFPRADVRRAAAADASTQRGRPGEFYGRGGQRRPASSSPPLTPAAPPGRAGTAAAAAAAPAAHGRGSAWACQAGRRSGRGAPTATRSPVLPRWIR